jgi:hypothetical protein
VLADLLAALLTVGAFRAGVCEARRGRFVGGSSAGVWHSCVGGTSVGDVELSPVDGSLVGRVAGLGDSCANESVLALLRPRLLLWCEWSSLCVSLLRVGLGMSFPRALLFLDCDGISVFPASAAPGITPAL